MEAYKNLGGNSGVVAYESGPDFIRVQFSDDSIYLYTNERPGPQYIQQMKILAQNGQGLNSYISRVVRKNYAQKER